MSKTIIADSKAEVKFITFALIKIDEKIQPREELNDEIVKRYRKNMDRGDIFPAGKAVFDGKVYWLYDGFHTAAAILLKDPESLDNKMKLLVVNGTRDLAIYLACGENHQHGLQYTSQQKRKIISRAILSAPKKDGKINVNGLSKHCHVGRQFVRRMADKLGVKYGEDKVDNPNNRVKPSPKKNKSPKPPIKSNDDEETDPPSTNGKLNPKTTNADPPKESKSTKELSTKGKFQNALKLAYEPIADLLDEYKYKADLTKAMIKEEKWSDLQRGLFCQKQIWESKVIKVINEIADEIGG